MWNGLPLSYTLENVIINQMGVSNMRMLSESVKSIISVQEVLLSTLHIHVKSVRCRLLAYM